MNMPQNDQELPCELLHEHKGGEDPASPISQQNLEPPIISQGQQEHIGELRDIIMHGISENPAETDVDEPTQPQPEKDAEIPFGFGPIKYKGCAYQVLPISLRELQPFKIDQSQQTPEVSETLEAEDNISDGSEQAEISPTALAMRHGRFNSGLSKFVESYHQDEQLALQLDIDANTYAALKIQDFVIGEIKRIEWNLKTPAFLILMFGLLYWWYDGSIQEH
ncbi:hypothetical protein EDC01DRAFT_636428 [Geopyxis carbonaria]|nr:hypothetical protein EDC01DRAFT_636428 [Geopyxis carbonaria]